MECGFCYDPSCMCSMCGRKQILVRKSQGYNKTKETTQYYMNLISVNMLIFIFLVTIVWVLL